MKYWDTSALLRAWKEGLGPPFGNDPFAFSGRVDCIQTGRGLVYRLADGTLVKRNLSPADAAREARNIFRNFQFRDLTGAQTLAVADLLVQRTDIAGVAIHDFMHAQAAELHGAESIVTLNVADFARMTKLPLEAPSRPE